MPMAAKPQKDERAGSCEVVPRMKATASVIEVIEIETPVPDRGTGRARA